MLEIYYLENVSCSCVYAVETDNAYDTCTNLYQCMFHSLIIIFDVIRIISFTTILESIYTVFWF